MPHFWLGEKVKRGNGETVKNLPKVHSFFQLFLTFDFFTSISPFTRFPFYPNLQARCVHDLTIRVQRLEVQRVEFYG